MPLTPDAFHARALASADADGRLPVPPQTDWDTFPFETDGLRTRPLQPPVVPEPARAGEGGRSCWRCADPEKGVVWGDDRWVLTRLSEPLGVFGVMLQPRAHLDLGDLDDVHAAEMGRLVVRVERAIRSLGSIGRVHVNKWGDGGAHLHLFFLARPEGLLQLRGSNVTLWEEMLPRVPEDEYAADLAAVTAAMSAGVG